MKDDEKSKDRGAKAEDEKAATYRKPVVTRVDVYETAALGGACEAKPGTNEECVTDS